MRKYLLSLLLTFAMVRSRLELGKKKGTDQEIADEIFESIQTKGRMRIVLNLAWPLSTDEFTEFYSHVRSPLINNPQNTPDGSLSNQWDVFLTLGTTGASSFLLLQELQRKDNQPTWQLWRNFLGDRIIAQAKPGTLRNEFGSEYNNVAHGSDSLESVRKDIRWMVRQIT